MLHRAPASTLFPYTTLFRSLRNAAVDELWYWEADHAGRLWAHYCRYLRVERPRLLEFTWMSEATRGLESRVTIEVTPSRGATRSEEHTSELQSLTNLVCRLL